VTTDRGSEPVLRILIVEDNLGDVFLVEEALKEAGVRFELVHITDGDQALDYLRKLAVSETTTTPDLVFLDLNLPKRDGWEVLEQLRAAPGQRDVPVVIFSSSNSPNDVVRAERLGAAKYIRKPSTLDEFLAIGQTVKALWSSSSS
jgi:chemotaxis family two-component system response regulator Rcp1